MLYIKLYSYYAPFDSSDDDTLAETGQWQIFITFFGALIIQNELLSTLGGTFDSIFEVLLVAVNLSLAVLLVYMEARIAYEDMQGSGASFLGRLFRRGLPEAMKNKIFAEGAGAGADSPESARGGDDLEGDVEAIPTIKPSQP